MREETLPLNPGGGGGGGRGVGGWGGRGQKSQHNWKKNLNDSGDKVHFLEDILHKGVPNKNVCDFEFSRVSTFIPVPNPNNTPRKIASQFKIK